jgi:exodeoxyribonuclease V beta subunit
MSTTGVSQVQGIWRDVAALDKDMRALMAVPLADAELGTLAQV